MVTTFFIGNGFDLGLGVYARFTDFYRSFKKQCHDTKNDMYIKYCDDLMQSEHGAQGNEEFKWAEFEDFIGKYSENIRSESKEDFLAFLDFFSLKFMDYLGRRSDVSKKREILYEMFMTGLVNYHFPIPDKFSLGFEKEMDALQNFCLDFQSAEDTFNILSFNYTEIIEDLLELKFQKGNSAEDEQLPHVFDDTRIIGFAGSHVRIGYMGHMHGSISHDPIMGVNDAEQIRGELKNDADYRRHVIKSELMDIDRNISEALIKEKLDESNVICLYGCSLGETDRKWWRLILESLTKDENRQLVVFVHEKPSEGGAAADVSDRIRWKKGEILNKLDEYATDGVSGETIDVFAMEDRIHIALNHDIFEPDYGFSEMIKEQSGQKNSRNKILGPWGRG